MKTRFLDEILENKRSEVLRLRAGTTVEELKRRMEQAPPARDFKGAIAGGGGIRIIAEVKKASPSKGIIREDFDPLGIARIYEENGAASLSVLTEERYFLGKKEYISLIRENVGLPVLRKDFMVDEYQVYESRAMGADAVLLIAAVLEKEDLERLHLLCRGLGMTPLVEVHTEEELDMALDAGAEVIGINNRDLETFGVDIETTRRLAPRVPDGRIVVSESGIDTPEDIRVLREAGAHAFLVGESLMREDDIGRKLRELAWGP